MSDPHDLQRFIEAQAPVYEQVRKELCQGRKTSHWMWFMFPQFEGLGRSVMAQRYALASRAEAEAYLGHAILGPRLLDCTQWVNQVKGHSLHDIFGTPDDLKFQSSMTLFATIAADNQVFREALEKYCGGQFDRRTLELLG